MLFNVSSQKHMLDFLNMEPGFQYRVWELNYLDMIRSVLIPEIQILAAIMNQIE